MLVEGVAESVLLLDLVRVGHRRARHDPLPAVAAVEP
jgi:hypothetical protein